MAPPQQPIDNGTLVRVLREDAPRARAQLAAVLAVLGPVRCADLLAETERVERSGGLHRVDGERRTVGGVFFHLARAQLTRDERKEIFERLPRRLKRLGVVDIAASFDVPGALRLWRLKRRQ